MEELLKKTETMLRAVLISSPRGVPLYRLDREYRSITFEPIPHSKLNFRNLEDFLRSIPKVARIQKDRDGETVVVGVASEADQHVAKLIAKQKKPKIRKSASRPARRPVRSSLSYTPAKHYTSKFGPRSARVRPLMPLPKQISQIQNQLNYNSSSAPSRTQSTPRFVPPRLRKMLGGDKTETTQPSFGAQSQRSAAFASPAEDKARQSPKTTKRTVKTKGIDFGGMEISVSSVTPPQSPIAKQPKTQTTLSPEVLERIAEIAGNNSNGFFLTRLPVIYKDKYQSELPSNVAEVLMSYPNILHVEKISNCYISYPPKIIKSSTSQVNNEEDTKQSEPEIKVIELYTVKPYTVPALGTPVQVYVSHIESANHFYVQYKDCEDQLKTLLERLDADMKDTSESISMPVSGMHCCAKFSLDGSWYRGRILECVQGKDTQSVKVFYLDFGNSEWLPHTRLSFLKMEHVEYPKMAVRCSLHGVRSDSGITEKLTSLLDKESTMTVVNRVGEVLFVQLSDERGVSIVATSVKQEEATPEKVQEREEETTPVVPAVKEEEEKPVVPLQKVQEIEDEMPVVPPEKVEEKEEETPVVPVHTTDETNKSPEPKKPVKPFLKMKSVSDDQEKKIPERVVIPDLEFLDIMVSTVFSTDNISVMLYGEEYTDKLLSLEISMMSYFLETSEENPSTPNVGEIWAIKSSELHSDAQYYRVKVLSITDDQAQLEFVDYGDTRQAPVSTLKTLPSRFLDLPFQAFTISLHGIPKTKKPQVLDKLKHHILDKPLVAEVFQRTQHKLEVEIYDTATELDVNINEVMRSLIIPDEDLLPALPKVGHQVEARISHITDTGSVFVQIPGAGLNRLEELMTDITEHYSKSTKAAEFVSQLSAGHICCAKCVDGSWYRAIILERMLDRKVKVQCVDYGNIEILPRTALREPTKVNKHVNLLPFQAKECHLHGLEKESWTAEQTMKMNELVSEDVILEVTKHDTIPMVKLFLTTEDDQQVNIVEYIQDELSSAKSESSADGSTTDLDQAEKESSSQDDDQDDLSPDLPPPITLSRPWVDVTISDAIDPGHFMPLEMIKILEEMTNEMTEHYKVTSEALVSPRNGDMCAVRDDGQYYRAVVKAVLSPQQICVMFMDYGNLGIHPSSDFRVLVDKFKQTPSIAVKGCLAGIQPLGSSGEWSDEAKKRFEELTWWKMLVGSVDGDQYTYDFREDLKVPLHLFDTSSDDKDINIADILLSEGLARRTEELK